MKVLLHADIDRLGYFGDVVEVSDGYARNCLLPQGLAILPSEANLRAIQKEKAAQAEQRRLALEQLKKVADEVGGAVVVIPALANEQGHLFGSVSETDIAGVLQEKGFEVQAKHVRMAEHFRALGEYEVNYILARMWRRKSRYRLYDPGMQKMTANPKQVNQASQSRSPELAEAASSPRVPPQSLEAEMCTLGSMILDVDCIGELVRIVKAENFYRHDHRLIFEALLALYEVKQAVDLVLLKDELKRRGQLDEVGKVDYLVRLAESVPSSANAAYYARIVRDQAMLRSLISVSTEICSQAYEAQGEVAEIIDEAEQKVFEITQQKISGQAVPIKEIMSQTFELIDQRRGSHVYGLATGFRELDELTGGLQNSEMIVVAARPSMGKTALGLNIAEYVGADSNRAVAVFSLEMAAQQLAERMLCGRAQIDSQKLRKSVLSDQEIQTMHDAAGELSEAKIYVDDSPGLTPLELRAKARRLKLQYDIELIVIDYLQLMHSPGSESRQMEVTTISRHLKAVARELNIPVVVMSQLNRSPEGREGHRPRMSDLRESGSIEQDADVVILLHREDYYHTEPDYEKNNEAEVIVAKQRNGPTGGIQLIWSPHWTRFLDYSHAHAPDGIGF